MLRIISTEICMIQTDLGAKYLLYSIYVAFMKFALLLKYNYKQQIPFIFSALLLISLLLSRAALSCISVLIVLNYFITASSKEQLKTFLSGFLLIIIPVLISGFWSNDQLLWWNSVLVKLPLLTVTIGLLSAKFTPIQIKQLIWLLTILILSGCLWSVYNFSINPQVIIKNYLVAKVMPTPLDLDYIRFSWLIVLGIVLLVWQLNIRSSKKEQISGSVIILSLIVYLHLLASKTGLICLYISGLIFLINYMFSRIYFKRALFIFLMSLLTGFACYHLFPTLHNRVQYAVWDYQQYSKGNILMGSDDGNRLISLKAGLNIAMAKPLTGSGFGDLRTEIKEWYKLNYPKSEVSERINPLNEWVLYAAASGWLGMIIFSVGLYILFYKIIGKNIFALISSIVLILPLLINDNLEGQFGVVIFSSVICLQTYLIKLSGKL